MSTQEYGPGMGCRDRHSGLISEGQEKPVGSGGTGSLDLYFLVKGLS